jgi:Mor family transcriptional regulator
VNLRELLTEGELAALAARWGGCRVYVPLPDRLSSEHPLVLALGLEVAVKVAHYHAKNFVQVPSLRPIGKRHSNPIRDALIIQQVRSGISIRDLALSYGLTERAVKRINARAAFISP